MRRFKEKKRKKTSHLITKLKPQSTITEQFRTIRTNLQFSSIDNEVTSVLVTSAGPQEGKSTTAANLAIVYAQQGKKTLLIEADLRKPVLHYMFQLESWTGLSNVLIGETVLEEAVESVTGVEFLDVLSSGPIPPNPSELLISTPMKGLLQHAKTLYDFIIIDSPPILAVTDAKIIANMTEGSLFVIRSGSTPTNEARQSIRSLEDTKAKPLGVILNDVQKKKGQHNYYYQY